MYIVYTLYTMNLDACSHKKRKYPHLYYTQQYQRRSPNNVAYILLIVKGKVGCQVGVFTTTHGTQHCC